MANFKELLSTPVAEIERPPNFPAGGYRGRTGKGEVGDDNKKKTPYVRYEIFYEAPGADIDPEELVDKKGKPIDITRKKGRYDFFLTPESQWRFKEFAKQCGLEGTEGMSLGELIPLCQNQPCLIDVALEPSQNNASEFYNTIKGITGTARPDGDD